MAFEPRFRGSIQNIFFTKYGQMLPEKQEMMAYKVSTGLKKKVEKIIDNQFVICSSDALICCISTNYGHILSSAIQISGHG